MFLGVTLAWPWAEAPQLCPARGAVRAGAWRREVGWAWAEQDEGLFLALQGSTELERGDEALWARRVFESELERVLAVLI